MSAPASVELVNARIDAALEEKPAPVARECPVCDQLVRVVNYGVERHGEVGYLGRHWRPGIARTAKCRGSFGRWKG